MSDGGDRGESVNPGREDGVRVVIADPGGMALAGHGVRHGFTPIRFRSWQASPGGPTRCGVQALERCDLAIHPGPRPFFGCPP